MENNLAPASRAVTAPSASQIAFYFDKERLTQMLVVANEFFKAGCFGADVKNTHQALVKIQAGYEMGMAPMEAMNSLYIVNGKVTIWGAAMSKRLRMKGWNITYNDGAATCEVTIKNSAGETHSYIAYGSDLEKLGSMAYKKSPKDKLRWHALSRLIRFEVPEVLDAGVSYLAEDEDIIEGELVEDKGPAPYPDIEALLEQISVAQDLAFIRDNLPSNMTKEDLSKIRKALIARDEALKLAEAMQPVGPTGEPPKSTAPTEDPDAEKKAWKKKPAPQVEEEEESPHATDFREEDNRKMTI